MENHNPNIEVTCLSSKYDGTFSEMLDSIFEQLDRLPKSKIPVKLTFFTSANNPVEYEFELNAIQKNAFHFGIYTPVALIGQTPAGNNGLVLELITIETSNNNVDLLASPDSLLLKSNNQEILFASVNSYTSKTFQENAEIAFQKLNIIMNNYQFNYVDVVRQWNYMQEILHLDDENGVIKQNYQIFNDCRSLQYSSNNFINGYPVATGIGTIIGGCCIEIVAIKGQGIDILPVHNTRQIDAHCYTEKVLVGNQHFEHMSKSTPKFERAKIVRNSTFQMLLVSGTASIIGEKTVCKGDAAGQTQTTIDNIKILLDSALVKCGCMQFKLLNFRAYIKHNTDLEAVKQVCNRAYDPNVGIF